MLAARRLFATLLIASLLFAALVLAALPDQPAAASSRA